MCAFTSLMACGGEAAKKSSKIEGEKVFVAPHSKFEVGCSATAFYRKTYERQMHLSLYFYQYSGEDNNDSFLKDVLDDFFQMSMTECDQAGQPVSVVRIWNSIVFIHCELCFAAEIVDFGQDLPRKIRQSGKDYQKRMAERLQKTMI